LIPIAVDEAWINRVKTLVPELPDARKARFEAEFGMSSEQSENLTADRRVADYFEAGVKAGADPVTMSNWIQGDVMRNLNERKIDPDQLKATPEDLAKLIHLIEKGTISNSIGKSVFSEMVESGESPEAIVEKNGLIQISDQDEMDTLIERIILDHPSEAERFRAGDKKLMGFFMGQVMKETRGQANPGVATQLIQKKLS